MEEKKKGTTGEGWKDIVFGQSEKPASPGSHPTQEKDRKRPGKKRDFRTNKKGEKNYTFKARPDLIQRLKAVSTDSGIEIKDIINRAIEYYLEHELPPEKVEKIRKNLEEIDRLKQKVKDSI